MRLNKLFEHDKQLFQDYTTKIGKLQSRIIVLSLITVLILGFIQVAVRLNILTLSIGQVSSLSSVMVSLLILFIAATFLKLTTPFMNKFLFFLDAQSRSLLLKAFNYIIWATAILIILAQFTGHVESLGISIGVFSAGLAIALQQPITSIVGWLVILAKRPYKIGDRIVVRENKGDVVEITLFYTVLREFGRDMGGDDPTGVKITIPNNIILTEPILNYTTDFPYIWDYVSVSVTYESDAKLAKKLVFDACNDVLGENMKKACERMKPHLYGTPQEVELCDEPIVYSNFGPSSVDLQARYICRAVRRRQVKSDITSRILELFHEKKNRDNVSVAYPHTELVFRKDSMDEMFRKYMEK